MPFGMNFGDDIFEQLNGRATDVFEENMTMRPASRNTMILGGSAVARGDISRANRPALTSCVPVDTVCCDAAGPNEAGRAWRAR